MRPHIFPLPANQSIFLFKLLKIGRVQKWHMVQVRCETISRSALQMGDQTRPRVELLATSETNGSHYSLVCIIDNAMQDPGMYSQSRARRESCPTLITYQFRQSQHRTTQPNRDRNLRRFECLAKLTCQRRNSCVAHKFRLAYYNNILQRSGHLDDDAAAFTQARKPPDKSCGRAKPHCFAAHSQSEAT